ncbi:MAG: peptide chain release factor N(5)-glutamine methyltransferase [Nocardioidaceae bacterium]|jgi:release factor glutamine methyltransferase|nr:peptide chain release factor N(5)-glutamine methyltransferase [Nocardioidaceae bacterium]
MTPDVASTLADGAQRLALAGVMAPRHDAEVLLASVLAQPRSTLHRQPSLSDGQLAAFAVALGRRAGREPLQHIVGTAAFRYLELKVGQGVFVPRPETEVMTGVAVGELHRLQQAGVGAPRAVDLCAGSGAVALAMATEVPDSVVTAVELSPEAVCYARDNAAGTGVDIRQGDIADAVDDLVAQVHVVTANPPYIPLVAFESVDVEAREFDPALALWSGDDGLDAIRVVCEVAARLLLDGGLVACEHADVQGDSAPAVFAASGRWAEVRDHTDLAGRPRFVTARRAPRRTALATPQDRLAR